MAAIVKRVVLVAIDGLRPEAIERFSLFNLRRLIERGASALTARSVSPDFTAARFTSLLTGVSPSAHGVVTERAGLPRALGRVEPFAGVIASAGFQVSGFLPEVPSSLAGRAGLTGREFGFNHLSFRGATSSDVVSSAINALCAQRRGLIAIQLPDVARVAYKDGGSPEYAYAAQRVDQSVGILASLSGASSGESLMIVVAGHGDPGEDRNGSDRQISVVLFGRCMSSRTMEDISLLDIPPTILWSLGLPIPLNYEGRTLVEAFESTPVPIRAFA